MGNFKRQVAGRYDGPEPIYCDFFEPRQETWVAARMVLGHPRQGCTGSGVCRIAAGTETLCKCANAVETWIGPVNYRCIQLVFDSRTFTPEQRIQFFSEFEMIVHERTWMPPEIARELGFRQNIALLPGRYPLFRYRQYFHHFVDCSADTALGVIRPVRLSGQAAIRKAGPCK
ncbi:MAG: hypothetical protein KDD12_10670 [Lewinella sp.]|nr:hypothetical protein [Lewinella sp.]